MHLDLHPDASANFNTKASDLLLLLAPIKNDPEPRTFETEQYIDHSLDDVEIIGDTTEAQLDFTGQEISRSFTHDNKLIGLQGEAYRAFFKLCENIQRTKQYTTAISLDLVQNELFEWMKSRYRGETNLPFLDFSQPRMEAEIKEIEIWVPIHSLLIQSNFSLGKIQFQIITKALIDRWEAALIENKTEEKANQTRDFFKGERKEIQGLAAATIKLVAESRRAGQIALDEIERTLNILRFFEPANFHPIFVSHCAIIGKQNIQTTKYYVVENNVLTSSTASMIDDSYRPWKIETQLLVHIQNHGLNILNSILLSENRTDFHNTIIDTLQTYSRVGLASNYSDKLVYLLVTLESLLLKNSSEPIEQNVAERMAFSLTKVPSQRKKIIENFKKMYALRSKFVHHANDVEREHIDSLSRFMFNVWQLLNMIINHANSFQNREQMIEAFDKVQSSF